MLAEYDIPPKLNPPGFTFVEGEPVFDPKVHLQLDAPERVWSLEEFGYNEKQVGQYASPVAVLSPIRLLSEEGVRAVRQVLELCKDRETYSPDGAGRLNFPTYQSKFMRDFHACKEVTDFLSAHFKTPIGPHPMPQMHVVNYSNAPGQQISHWHHDSIAFTMVMSMFDPQEVKGGRFEYFWGTREEAQDMLDQEDNGNHGELPRNRVNSPMCEPGVACFMQGTAIMHRGQPMDAPGYRSSVVFSYVSRDVSFPDPNRTAYEAGWKTRGLPEGVTSPRPTEWARHRAWFSKARLATLIDELPFTDDRAFIARQLKLAISPVLDAIDRLENLDEPSERGRGKSGTGKSRTKRFFKDDDVQMTEERFQPGKLPETEDA